MTRLGPSCIYRLLQLCFDWSPEELARLTASDPGGTNLWVVPMNHINFKSLGKLSVWFLLLPSLCMQQGCLVYGVML